MDYDENFTWHNERQPILSPHLRLIADIKGFRTIATANINQMKH
jgi:hypothetical protein